MGGTDVKPKAGAPADGASPEAAPATAAAAPATEATAPAPVTIVDPALADAIAMTSAPASSAASAPASSSARGRSRSRGRKFGGMRGWSDSDDDGRFQLKAVKVAPSTSS